MTTPRQKAILTMPQSLLFLAVGIVLGYILISIAHTMSDKLASIEMPCRAQSFFTGSQSSDCYWGTTLLSFNGLFFLLGYVSIGLGVFVGGAFFVTAYRAFSEVNQIDQAIAANTNKPQSYYERGKVWRSRKEYDKALADFTKAIELDGTFILALNDRGLVYIAKAEWDKALADFTEAIKHDPHRAASYNARGVTWEMKKDFSKALSDFQKATALDPESLHFKQNLAKLKAKIDIDKTANNS